jgi:hypothetical protein
MKLGTVFLHKNYQFHDGGIANKFFIIINNPRLNDPILACKTTSKPDSRPDKEGCHYLKNQYVLRANDDFFKLKTWVNFFPLYPFNHKGLMKLMQGGDVIKMAELRPQTISAIVNCVKKSEDITFYDLELIKK